MSNVVLLGESHFAMTNGIQKGLKNMGCDVFNLSLGATPCIQNLYEVIRNKQIIKKADLIITGSNTHDVAQYNNLNLMRFCYRNLNWLYKELFFLNKKIISFISPMPQTFLDPVCLNTVVNIHKTLSNYYGFNFIDMHEYYTQTNLYDFQALRDGAHDFDFIMRELGKNIAQNIDKFKMPRLLNISNDNPKFEVFTPSGKTRLIQNSFYSEKIYEICNNDEKLTFKAELIGYFPIAIHTWNYDATDGGDIIITDKKSNILSNTNIAPYMFVKDLYNDSFQIQKDTFLTPLNLKEKSKINFISIFLASSKGNYYNEDLDIEILNNKNIKISKEYDFNHLIPPVELYKEMIDEYCAIVEARKLDNLTKDFQVQNSNQQNTIACLNFQVQYSSAKLRVQNHLSYKLGQAMIMNSKNKLRTLFLPFILLSIVISYKEEQKVYKFKTKTNPNLILPPLETYPDYEQALKEKKCFTYQLGQVLIQANRNWYGGGVFEIVV